MSVTGTEEPQLRQEVVRTLPRKRRLPLETHDTSAESRIMKVEEVLQTTIPTPEPKRPSEPPAIPPQEPPDLPEPTPPKEPTEPTPPRPTKPPPEPLPPRRPGPQEPEVPHPLPGEPITPPVPEEPELNRNWNDSTGLGFPSQAEWTYLSRPLRY
jgi:hypothetical protein